MPFPSVSPKRFLVVALLAVAAFSAAALTVPRLPIGGPLGAWMAQRDIARGAYAYKAPLTNGAWEREWKRTMHCEYGIQLKDQELSCFKTAFANSYDQAYNHVQLAAIESRFGSNVVFTIRDRLRQAWTNKTAKS